MEKTMVSTSSAKRSIALVIGFACLAALAEGYEMQAPGVTLPILSKVFNLKAESGIIAGFFSQRSLFLSIGIFGLIAGSAACGFAADRFGRKWVAIGSVAVFGVFTLLTAYAPNTKFLLAWRFLTGFGLGGALPSLMALIAETVSASRRATAIGIFQSTMPIGGMLVALISIAYATPSQWTIIYIVGGILPLLAAAGLALALPSNAGQSGAIDPSTPISEATAKGERASPFSNGRAGITGALWLAYVCLMIGSAILLGWMPILLHAGGLKLEDAFWAQVGFNIFAVAGYILAGFLMDHWSRRATVILVYGAAILALAALASAPAKLPLVVGSACCVGMAMSAAGTVIYTLALNAYPSEIRGRGVGYAIAMGRLGSAIGPLIGGAMLGAGLSPMTVLMALVPLVLIAGIAVNFVNSAQLQKG